MGHRSSVAYADVRERVDGELLPSELPRGELPVEASRREAASRPQRRMRSGLRFQEGRGSEQLGQLYAAALLKVAVELRQPEPESLVALLDRILEDTPIDRLAFQGYLQRNLSLIRR